jgi:SAM-dependent methyltransferase
VVVDPLPTERFDLIHGRLVTAPIPSQPQALAQMVSALKPGGWLVLDEYDVALIDQTYPTADATEAARYRKMRAAQDELMRRRGVDLAWGRSLYRRMRAHGLVEVRMEGTVRVFTGGDPGTRLMRANYEQIRAEAVSAGLVIDEEVEQVLALLDDPSFAVSGGFAQK